MPASVEALGDEAFSFCSRLRSVDFTQESRLKQVGSRCFYRSGLEAFAAPHGLLCIGEEAFARCPRLLWVDLGRRLAELGVGAFMCSAVRVASVPGELGWLSESVFLECRDLASVQIVYKLGVSHRERQEIAIQLNYNHVEALRRGSRMSLEMRTLSLEQCTVRTQKEIEIVTDDPSDE